MKATVSKTDLVGFHSRIVGLLFGLVLSTPLIVTTVADSAPPIRTGLWVLQKLPANGRELTTFSNELQKSRNLSGVCLTIWWQEIEGEEGRPNFKRIDDAIAVLRRVGMKYQIGLKPGVQTPDYVYRQGARAFSTRVANPHRANYGQAIRIPVPWDPIYQRNFSRVIRQLGERYANDPLCVSVVLTCANFMSAEMHLPKSREDLAQWHAFGDYKGKLLEVYEKYNDEWARAFPRQEISLHISKLLDLPPAFCDQIIDYGLSKEPTRFTIQNCQLTGRREDTGMVSYDVVMRYRKRLHHGYQSLAGLSRPNDRMGSIELAALNLVHGAGEYWELWHGDGMNPTTTDAVAAAWREARQLGYEGYKAKLIADGKYRSR